MKILNTINCDIHLPVSHINTYKDSIEINLADTLDYYLENETPDNPIILVMNLNTMSFLQRLIPENWRSETNSKIYYTNIESYINFHMKDGEINICTFS